MKNGYPFFTSAFIADFSFQATVLEQTGKNSLDIATYFLPLMPTKICKERQLVSNARKISFLCTRCGLYGFP